MSTQQSAPFLSVPSSASRAAGPCLLALDTATETLHLALVCGTGTRVLATEGGARASATLIPTILALLADAGATLADLDAIAFGCGPGAFTGLRTAASVTQGLALGRGKPVLCLDTLMASAEDARRQGADPRCVCVAHDARMNEVYAASYAWDGQAWQTLQAAALMSPRQWLDHVRALQAQAGPASSPVPSALAGNALAALPDLAGAAATLALPAWPDAAPRGAALAALALQAWTRGQQIDAELALPVYVRDKVAFTTAEREAQKLAKAAP